MSLNIPSNFCVNWYPHSTSSLLIISRSASLNTQPTCQTISTRTNTHIQNPKNKIQEPHEPAAPRRRARYGQSSSTFQGHVRRLAWSCLSIRQRYEKRSKSGNNWVPSVARTAVSCWKIINYVNHISCLSFCANPGWTMILCGEKLQVGSMNLVWWLDNHWFLRFRCVCVLIIGRPHLSGLGGGAAPMVKTICGGTKDWLEAGVRKDELKTDGLS